MDCRASRSGSERHGLIAGGNRKVFLSNDVFVVYEERGVALLYGSRFYVPVDGSESSSALSLRIGSFLQ